MSAKKAIQINPEYFSLKKNRSLKKQPREKKPKNKTGKQQKKELLKRLKEIQESKEKKKYNKEEKNNNIGSSIDFLNILSNEHKNKNSTLAPATLAPTPATLAPASATLAPATLAPATLAPATLAPEPTTFAPAPATLAPATLAPEPATLTPAPATLAPTDTLVNKKEPPYSNLKGSKKPSYREWLKSQHQKVEIHDNDIKDSVATTLREEKLKKIQKKYKKQAKHCKTIKITETFGKRNGKVSIHIKNKENKEQLENEKKTLKKHSIPKIKAYLKEHNLLKIGSYAPNDVIRELYENAMLSGDITNNNKDILVHNFLEN
jgi:hypothetical protein